MRSLTVRKSASFCACRSVCGSISGESFTRHDVQETAIPVRDGPGRTCGARRIRCLGRRSVQRRLRGVRAGERRAERRAESVGALRDRAPGSDGLVPVRGYGLRSPRMRDAASAAAAVSRTQVPDKAAIALAAAFAEAEQLCNETLGAAAAQTSRRFLFGDADLAVTRFGTLWRVRSGATEFEDPLLGSALALACSWLSPGRVGELAMQILDRDAHVGPDAV